MSTFPYPRLTVEFEQSFWEATVECLDLLGVEPESQRRRLVTGLVDRLEKAGDEKARELVFHSEPGDVACDLVGLNPDSDRGVRLQPQFLEIAHRHLASRGEATETPQ